ncbi:MAG: TetR/AcrR family transcriptional regulator [Planctomycetota bacterium]
MARCREFDTDETLDRCLGLFWAKGFDGVSISDLEQATGLGRQSLYAAFGNKEQLFAAVLDRYAAHSDAMLAPLLTDAAGLAEIHGYAANALAAQRRSGCSGCLIVKALWDQGVDDEQLQKRAQAATRRVRAAFVHAIERAVARGEASPGDASLRADLAFAAINGLAALRRTGVSEPRALASLDALLESWRS